MNISFNGGSIEQQNLITQAQQFAATLVTKTLQAIPSSPDYITWFGTSSKVVVTGNFNTLLTVINNGVFLYDFTTITTTQVTNGLYFCYGQNSTPSQRILLPCLPLFLQPNTEIAIMKAALSIIQQCAVTTTNVDTVIAGDKAGARYIAQYAPALAITSPANYRFFVEDLTLSAFPIGCITTFGGDLSDSSNLETLMESGWLLCDGSAYDKTAYPDLYDAIGSVNGGDAITFNVPDLRSRFLRGTAYSSINIDPDAATRIAANSGGAVGNAVGSLQKTASGLPNSPWLLQNAGLHTHTCQHLTSDMHMAWNGMTYTMARWNSSVQVDNAGAHFHTLTGFDTVSSPINLALYFIIKASEPQVPTGTTPCGAILAFGGQMNLAPPKWLKCNGAAYGVNIYPNLLNTILYNYGGDGQTVLNVPDLRGYILRGTSHLTNRDPDASSRHELNTGGNTGDAIGSAQFYATATPSSGISVSNAGYHSHNIALVPQDDHHAAWGASGPLAYNCMEWTNDLTTSSQAGDHNHSVTGGDKETRPENIYADFIIASDNLTQSAPPIGTILSFGGDITDPGIKSQLMMLGWLPCDGSSVRISSFQALYDVIGGIFGSAPLKFSVPDLRGFFVIGAGKVAVGNKQLVSTTGIPVTPIITSTNGDHTHIMYNIPTDTHEIDVVAGVDLAENNANKSPTSGNGLHTHIISGGDKESRPVNVNVDYIIRFQ